MSSPSDGPPSTGSAPPPPTTSTSNNTTAPSSAASSSTSTTAGSGSGGGSGGGLGHSAPLRTLLSPTSGMALVHGSGVATATSTSSTTAAANTSTIGQHHPPAPPFPAVVQQAVPPYQQQTVQQQQQPMRPTVVAAIPPPPTPIQRQARPDVTITPQTQPQQQPQFGAPASAGAKAVVPGGGGSSTPAAPDATAAAARHSVMTPAPPVAPPAPPPTTATTNPPTTTTTASAPASAPLPISAVRQIQQSQQQRQQSAQSAAVAQQSQQQRMMRQPAQPQPPPPTMWAAESNAAANSLEADVEAFLSAGSGGGVGAGPSPTRFWDDIKHPFEGYRNVMDAARRRAWGDVVQLTGDLLGNPASPYQPFYSALLHSGDDAAAAAAANPATGASSSGGPGQAPDMTAAAAYGDARLPVEACEVVSLRFHALLRLRRYVDLGREVEMLNLLPSPAPPVGGVGDSGGTQKRRDKLPAWVPYGLKILAAQSLQYTDKPQKCFDTLYTMREDLSPGGENDDTATRERGRWIGRVDAALSNAFMRQKEWRLALSALDDLIDVLPRCVGWEVDSWLEAERSSSGDDETRLFVSPGEMARASSAPPTSSKNASAEHRKTLVAVLLSAARIDVLSRQGRVLLQVGALPEADVVFELAKSEAASLELVSKLPPPSSGGGVGSTASDMLRGSVLVRQAPTQLVVNDGLASFAKERYDAAMDRFQEAVELQRNQSGGGFGESPLAAAMGVNHVDNCLHPGVGVDAEDCLVAQCLNNMALCALYSCQMLKAVNLIESLIREDPTVFLTEVLAFNLCTLYELGSDNALSGRKKRMVQLIAKKFSLHDIGTESFRIN